MMTKTAMFLAAISLLSIVPTANGMRALKTKALSRLVQMRQVQRVAALSQLLTAQQLSSKTSSQLFMLVALSESESATNDKKIPDRKPSRTTSPDSPNSGRPTWDQPRRNNKRDSRDARYSDSGGGDARYSDSGRGDARFQG